jgi:hypothetical protein
LLFDDHAVLVVDIDAHQSLSNGAHSPNLVSRRDVRKARLWQGENRTKYSSVDVSSTGTR